MTNDKELHQQFVKSGNDRRKLTNELLAILPEIFEKEIYKKYAGSIIEYAGKFGGLSKGVVLKRLRLEKYVGDKPILRDAIRTEGIHKVAMMASLATVENEEFLVDKIKGMSKAAVQELSKEMRSHDLFASNSAGAVQTLNCKAVPQKITIELDEETSFLFLKLKKRIGKNMSNKEAMKKILEMVGGEVGGFRCEHGGAGVAEEVKTERPTDKKVIPGDNFKINITDYTLAKPTTRYIPPKIKKQIISKTNGKCSYPNCNKPAEIFHHANRFAVSHSHDSLTLLCKIHHEFAHNNLIENETMDTDAWKLEISGWSKYEVSQADILYKKYRREALV